jgi:hypothetical protein
MTMSDRTADKIELAIDDLSSASYDVGADRKGPAAYYARDAARERLESAIGEAMAKAIEGTPVSWAEQAASIEDAAARVRALTPTLPTPAPGCPECEAEHATGCLRTPEVHHGHTLNTNNLPPFRERLQEPFGPAVGREWPRHRPEMPPPCTLDHCVRGDGLHPRDSETCAPASPPTTLHPEFVYTGQSGNLYAPASPATPAPGTFDAFMQEVEAEATADPEVVALMDSLRNYFRAARERLAAAPAAAPRAVMLEPGGVRRMRSMWTARGRVCLRRRGG